MPRCTIGGVLVAALALAACPAPQIINHPPVAFAGYDRSAVLGDAVILDGSQSYDPDGNSLLHRWWAQDPAGVRSELEAAAVVRYVPLAAGRYLFFLQVDDGALASAPDLVTVRVAETAAATQLVARIAESKKLVLRFSTELDGTPSTGPDPAALSYRWQLVDWPEAALVDRDYEYAVATDTPAHLAFTPRVAGAFVFALQVSDDHAVSDLDFATVGVGSWTGARAEAPAAARFAIGADGTATVSVEAQIQDVPASDPNPLVEWWVLSAPDGAECPRPGDTLTGTSVENVGGQRMARLRTSTRCAGVWQLLICPLGPVTPASCPVGRDASAEDATVASCCNRIALTASCCLGLADRFMMSVEELTP